MELACQQREARKNIKLKYLCSLYRNSPNIKIDLVWNDLYYNGFAAGYKIWFLHEEWPDYASNSEPYVVDSVEEPGT